MNQDFALVATPANARRLLLFRRVGPLDLTDDIIALAEQDRLDPMIFDPLVCPYDPVRYAIAQFLLDNGLRGCVQRAYHPEINPISLLTIIQTMAVPIIILTTRQRAWSHAATAVGGTIRCINSPQWFIDHFDEYDRHAALIIDTHDGTANWSSMRHLLREFPRSIIYDDHDLASVVPWPVWGRVLSPDMPHPLILRLVEELPAQWQDLRLVQFALFYGIALFPECISIPSIVAAMEDDYIASRLSRYMSLLRLTL